MSNCRLPLSVIQATNCSMPMNCTTRAFDDAEKLALTQAWIATAEDYAAKASTASLKSVFGRPGVFWDKVRANYSLNVRVRTAAELLAQWQTMVRSMGEFLKLFEQKYFESRQDFHNDWESVGQAFKWAAAEYKAKTGAEFREVNAASLLTNHQKWWTVLKPLVNLQQDATVEAIDTDQPQAASGTVHVRSEDEENHDIGRCVRQRLNTEAPILQGSKVEVLLSPLGSTSSGFSPSSAQSTLHRPSLSLSECLEMRKVEVMERQLDLQIMTQSQEGLSDEAVEYLRWQRHLVLAKMRRGINKEEV
ncbi:hypothetical protein F443_12161 [Phytophthora nicotianae P1569]|uniref:No apical meristem-associated C-terminal domain-containing protein n=1 Tax=Phytophthora nicotianae P1569 TaxID=1317065 RepID=V9EU06_PHYNI|nr:hypothetical protein F443_12161 [Phytophthora nicotianae P1569]